MGYTILIGNGVLESDWENEYGYPPSAEWVVKKVSLDEAPYSNDLTGRSNTRSPSYTGWSDFVGTVGLRNMFYNTDKTGLMDRHPGCARLTKTHAEIIRQALEDYRSAHPDAVASFCECRQCEGPWSKSEVPHNPHCDGTLVRLTWLDFWVNWAVENCERPAIYNR